MTAGYDEGQSSFLKTPPAYDSFTSLGSPNGVSGIGEQLPCHIADSTLHCSAVCTLESAKKRLDSTRSVRPFDSRNFEVEYFVASDARFVLSPVRTELVSCV
jgi:hypothetical protein